MRSGGTLTLPLDVMLYNLAPTSNYTPSLTLSLHPSPFSTTPLHPHPLPPDDHTSPGWGRKVGGVSVLVAWCVLHRLRRSEAPSRRLRRLKAGISALAWSHTAPSHSSPLPSWSLSWSWSWPYVS